MSNREGGGGGVGQHYICGLFSEDWFQTVELFECWRRRSGLRSAPSSQQRRFNLVWVTVSVWSEHAVRAIRGKVKAAAPQVKKSTLPCSDVWELQQQIKCFWWFIQVKTKSEAPTTTNTFWRKHRFVSIRFRGYVGFKAATETQLKTDKTTSKRD